MECSSGCHWNSFNSEALEYAFNNIDWFYYIWFNCYTLIPWWTYNCMIHKTGLMTTRVLSWPWPPYSYSRSPHHIWRRLQGPMTAVHINIQCHWPLVLPVPAIMCNKEVVKQLYLPTQHIHAQQGLVDWSKISMRQHETLCTTSSRAEPQAVTPSCPTKSIFAYYGAFTNLTFQLVKS